MYNSSRRVHDGSSHLWLFRLYSQMRGAAASEVNQNVDERALCLANMTFAPSPLTREGAGAWARPLS